MEHAFFETINNKQVFGILTHPQLPTKKIVIMSHGFRGNTTGASRTFANFKNILAAAGYSVLRFDQPNSGNSQGAFINSSFKEWVATLEYFAKKYADEGYEVVLLGQSMGATASVVASASDELRHKISALLLWVPDPKSDVSEWLSKEQPAKNHNNNVLEEAGQRYRASFWQEVKDADFFACLNEYTGAIHLVYGEKDMFVSEGLKKRVMDVVSNKGQQAMILKGQDHIGWDYDACEEVYKTELEFIQKL